MAIETSSDLQKIVLTAIMNDPDMFGSIITDMEDSFFSNNNYQYIYKVVSNFFKAYGKIPTDQELLFIVKQDYKPEFGNLTDILSDANDVLGADAPDARFVTTSVERFISRAKFEAFLSDAAEKQASDKSFTMESLMDNFAAAKDYHVTDVDCMRLDDFDKYSKIREDIFGADGDSRIIKSSITSINQHLTYKGYKPTDLITVVGAPGTGKTSFLINEGLAASLQGFNVLHAYFGDMNEITASNRYMARLTGMPIDTYSLSPENYHNVLMNDPRINTMGIFNRIYTVSFAPGEVSADKLRAVINKLQDRYQIHFDMVIVDYADNLAEEDDSLYTNGGKIYNKLKAIAKNNKCVVLTASQPKNEFFEHEVIPFAGIAESSKKLHIVDTTITIGKFRREADIATMLLAKVREGTTGQWIRLKLELATQKIYEISENDYEVRKSEIYNVAKAAGVVMAEKKNYKERE
jgi:KaiC/GvpD/RAD55 family RecA-like ATPase